VLVGFLIYQRRRTEPLVPLSLFRDRDFALGNITIGALSAAVTALPPRQQRPNRGRALAATRRAAAQVIVDLINHRELFTSDRVTATLRPWGGAAPSAVAEMPCGTGQNRTNPLDDSVLRPLLSAATYLVDVIAPQVIELSRQIADADRK
jgi:hypothetical protein